MTYSMDSGHNFDRGVEFAVAIPLCQVLEALFEESGLHILQEVDALEVGNGGGGDIFRWSTVGSGAAGDISDAVTARGGVGKGGSSEESNRGDGRGMHYERIEN